MHTPILDSQISRALVQPTPWEAQQWRAAALRDKAEWSKLIDIGSSHRFCDDVQRSVDTEIRRERMWCGPAPCVAAAAPVPTELTRNEYYQARNLFAWMRADSRTEVTSKVTAFVDKVALPANGGLANNARSIDPNHAFVQTAPGNQVAAIATSALISNREVGIFTGAERYSSSLSASNWAPWNNGAGSQIWTPYLTSSGTNGNVLGNSAGATAPGINLYSVISGHTDVLVLKSSGSFSVNSGQVGTVTTNVPTYLDFALSSGAWSFWQKATLLGSGVPAAAGGVPTHTMTIGSDNDSAQSLPFIGQLPDVMFANQVSATLQTAVRRYLLLRYFL